MGENIYETLGREFSSLESIEYVLEKQKKKCKELILSIYEIVRLHESIKVAYEANQWEHESVQSLVTNIRNIYADNLSENLFNGCWNAAINDILINLSILTKK